MPFRIKKKYVAGGAIVVVALVFFVIPFYIAYSSLNPERCTYTATPSDYGLSYREFGLATVDGVNISVWLIEPPTETKRAVYILMHGYTSCKASEGLLELASELSRRGYIVVLFDFRGHGESGGKTTIGPREVFDVETVVKEVERLYPGYDIILVGFSMGGALAVVAGTKLPEVDAIAADSPYYSLEDVIPRWLDAYTPFPAWLGSLAGFYGEILADISTEFGPKYIMAINKPLLVFYGTEDPLVLEDEMRRIVDRSNCGRLIVVEAGHVEAPEYLGIERYVDLLEELLNQTKTCTWK